MKEIKYLVIGGGRKLEPQTWDYTASKIFEYSFSVYEDDFDFESCREMTTTGSQLSPLSQAAAVKISEKAIMVWGGHNLATFSMDNELFRIKFAEKNKRRLADITIYKNHEIDPNYKFLQSGDVPSGRCGHTLTKISDNCFVLIGGIEFRNRFSD